MTNKDKNVLLGELINAVDKISVRYSSGAVEFIPVAVTWNVDNGVASMVGVKTFTVDLPGTLNEVIAYMSNYSTDYVNHFAKANVSGGTQIVNVDDVFKINSASFTLSY